MSNDVTPLDRTELAVDLALRELWQILDPIISEADAGGAPIGVPQLACSMRAAYQLGYADAERRFWRILSEIRPGITPKPP